MLSDAGPDNTYAVGGVAVHPDFDPFAHAFDAAVLTLAAPVSDPTVEPTGLVAVGGRVRPATRAQIAGWGYRAFDVPGSASDHLHAASVRITGFKACRKAYRGSGVRISRTTMMCAGATGRDACQGDSGGPIFVRTAQGPVQIAVASFGIGCAFRRIPGVYARLADPSIGGFVRTAIDAS